MSAFEQQREICGFKIGKTLGKGMSGKVKLGTRISDGAEMALKFIDRSTLQVKQLEMLSREIQAMNLLSHPNILTLTHVEEEVNYPRKKGGFRSCVMLVLEICPGGELFDYLMHTGPFNDVLARTYFRNMLGALELCHSQGICHRDIKPENLLVSSDFSLKLADFGLASVNTEADTLCATECGTRSYMSPEVMLRKPYDGSKADIWSAGVVLFILISGFPPFQIAGGNDWWYRACKANRHDKFWMAHLRTCPTFPIEAQELLNGIFQIDPNNRFTIDQIWDSKWMQGPVLSHEELYEVMSKRTEVTIREKEKERQDALAEKARNAGQTFDPYAANTYRSIQSDDSDNTETTTLSVSKFILTNHQAGNTFELLNQKFKDLGATNVKLNGSILKASIPYSVMKKSETNNENFDFDVMPKEAPSMSAIGPLFGDTEIALHIELSYKDMINETNKLSVQQVEVKKLGGSQYLFADFISTYVTPTLQPEESAVESGEALLDTVEDEVF